MPNDFEVISTPAQDWAHAAKLGITAANDRRQWRRSTALMLQSNWKWGNTLNRRKSSTPHGDWGHALRTHLRQIEEDFGRPVAERTAHTWMRIAQNVKFAALGEFDSQKAMLKALPPARVVEPKPKPDPGKLTRVDRAEEAASEATARAEKVIAERDDARKRIADLEDQLKHLESEKLVASGKSRGLDVLANVQAQRDHAKHDVHNLQAEVNDLKRSLRACTRRCKELERERDALQARLA